MHKSISILDRLGGNFMKVTVGVEYKKTAPYPPWDKSCTPAIPPKLTHLASARFTRHHACPMDNGWGPVGIYLVSRSSRPRKTIHTAAPRPDPTTQDSLLVCSPATFLSHRFDCTFYLWIHYSQQALDCQPSGRNLSQ